MKVWLKMSSRRLKGSRSDDQQSAQTASSVDSEGSVEVEDESADIESAQEVGTEQPKYPI